MRCHGVVSMRCHGVVSMRCHGVVFMGCHGVMMMVPGTNYFHTSTSHNVAMYKS